MDLSLVIQKNIVGIRISILDILCAPTFSQTTLNFSIQICPKKDLGLETEKSNVGTKINIGETLSQFSAKLDNFDFFGTNLPKKEIRT